MPEQQAWEMIVIVPFWIAGSEPRNLQASVIPSSRKLLFHLIHAIARRGKGDRKACNRLETSVGEVQECPRNRAHF